MKLVAKLFIILVVLAILGTYSVAKMREARIEARYPPLGQTINVHGKRVQAYVTGTGPDLVMLHGSSGNMRDMILALEETLAPHFSCDHFLIGLVWVIVTGYQKRGINSLIRQ
jgi:hypothetical protein